MAENNTAPQSFATGDVAIVTGAARRLGREISLSLAERIGLDIVIHYGRSNDAAQQLATDLQGRGRRSVTVSADLRCPNEAAETVFEAAAELGTVRVLVNCAAVFEDRPLSEIDVDHWEHQLTINALAPLMLSRQFAAQLSADQSGHIINILDWRASRPPANFPVYTASKAALASLTKSLALQLSPRIQVNAIAPGAVLSPDDAPDRHLQRAAESVPLRRPGCPADVCEAAVFLLRSSFITGEILHVSGGEQL